MYHQNAIINKDLLPLVDIFELAILPPFCIARTM
jgi:hypothetical protein